MAVCLGEDTFSLLIFTLSSSSSSPREGLEIKRTEHPASVLHGRITATYTAVLHASEATLPILLTFCNPCTKKKKTCKHPLSIKTPVIFAHGQFFNLFKFFFFFTFCDTEQRWAGFLLASVKSSGDTALSVCIHCD